jgi:hypothetical protein
VNIKQRRKARHKKRLAKRDKLREQMSKGTALVLYQPPETESTAVQTPAPAPIVCVRPPAMVIPRMVHTERFNHPTWDKLLNHISQPMGLQASRRHELNHWVHGLLSPTTAMPALVLAGPECGGKTTFHEAMGLLLPDRAVLHVPMKCRQEEWLARLREAWLMVIEGHPERYAGLFGKLHFRNGRYLKWCVTSNHAVDPMPDVQQFEVGMLATTAPNMLRRLADEREAFLESLGQPLAWTRGRPRLAA